jgi:hypothetical protein
MRVIPRARRSRVGVLLIASLAVGVTAALVSPGLASVPSIVGGSGSASAVDMHCTNFYPVAHPYDHQCNDQATMTYYTEGSTNSPTYRGHLEMRTSGVKGTMTLWEAGTSQYWYYNTNLETLQGVGAKGYAGCGWYSAATIGRCRSNWWD